MKDITKQDKEKQRITVSVVVPLLFISLLWLVYFIEYAMNIDFSPLGIFPRDPSSLPGIFFTPFLHGSFGHLLSNSIPLLVLGSGLIYFYRNIAYRVFLWIWLIDGLGVWLLGREAYHIGASGLVYGVASFLIFSGILRKNQRLLALSLTVIFIYGSLIWGMLPYVPDISWEAHLFGFLAGIYFSIHYMKQGPPNDPLPEWMNEEEEEGEKMESEPDAETGLTSTSDGEKPGEEIRIIYTFRAKDDEKKSGD